MARAKVRQAARNFQKAIAAHKKELTAKHAKASGARKRALAQQIGKVEKFAAAAKVLDFGARQCLDI